MHSNRSQEVRRAYNLVGGYSSIGVPGDEETDESSDVSESAGDRGASVDEE